MKDLISQTFHIVVDTRFKVGPFLPTMQIGLIAFNQDGIEKVDAAYSVFFRNGFEDFQQYSFELQTVATQNLDPMRIKEYLRIIHQEQGFAVCQVKQEPPGMWVVVTLQHVV